MFKLNYKFLVSGLFAVLCLTTTAYADLSDVLSSGKVKIAVPESFSPFGSIGPEGDHVGYDVDVAKLVAKNLGVELVVDYLYLKPLLHLIKLRHQMLIKKLVLIL